jgi:hypothetical protein
MSWQIGKVLQILLKGFPFSKGIGGNNMSSPIFWRNHSWFLEYRQGRSNLRIFWGIPLTSLSKSQLDAPIYIGAVMAERNIFLSPLCLFAKTSPLNWAVASGNGNKRNLRIFWGVHLTSLIQKSQLDAPIYWCCYGSERNILSRFAYSPRHRLWTEL